MVILFLISFCNVQYNKRNKNIFARFFHMLIFLDENSPMKDEIVKST